MANDIPRMDQGLLVRNPALTEEEFSKYWYEKHSQVVIPFFLHSGIAHYEQIHGPLHPLNSTIITSVPSNQPLSSPLSHFSGACALPPQVALDRLTFPKWKQAYYDEVIKADEQRFLVSKALDHVVRIAPQSVRGERKVVIEEGKALVEVSKEAWAVWKEYEAMGEEGKEEKK